MCAKFCPLIKENVTYLFCEDCDERLCRGTSSAQKDKIGPSSATSARHHLSKRNTGVKDKNGVEIHENDLVIHKLREDSPEIYGLICFGKYATVYENEKNHLGWYIQWEEHYNGVLRPELGFWVNKKFIEVIQTEPGSD